MIAGMIFYVPFVRLGYKFRIIGKLNVYTGSDSSDTEIINFHIHFSLIQFIIIILFFFFNISTDRWTVVIQLLLQVAPTKLVLPD